MLIYSLLVLSFYVYYILYIRIFSHVENGFNHIKDEFLAYQVSRGGDPSPDQNTRCTCPYTGFNQPVVWKATHVPIYMRGLCSILFCELASKFYTVLIHLSLSFFFIRKVFIISWCKNILLISLPPLLCFSGSINTIIYFKTGNHLPQHLWFSNSFFTLDGCLTCVLEILRGHFRYERLMAKFLSLT